MANAINIAPNVAGGLQTVSMGAAGGDWIDNTTNLDGVAAGVTWGIITATTATVFTTLTTSTISVNGAAITNLNGKTLAAGLSIFGRFTSITLTSVSIIAYRLPQ